MRIESLKAKLGRSTPETLVYNEDKWSDGNYGEENEASSDYNDTEMTILEE